MRALVILVFHICLLGFGAFPAAGFQVAGSISGTVSDRSGALVPEAIVTLTAHETGQLRRAVANDRGRYRFAGLSIGSYTVRAEHEGFLPSEQDDVEVSIGQSLALDIVLNVSGGSETVTVTATPAAVETMSSQVGGIVHRQQIEDLPLNGRDLTQLVAFQAGVATPPVSSNQTKLSISGGRPYQTSFLLDGTDVSRWDGKPGGVTGLMLGVESVGEFVVLSNLFTSEYGGTGTSIVSSVTKSGTNEFHGSAYYYARDSVFDAKNYFDADDEPIPDFYRHQFGGSFSGPVVKDRLFFFGNYEGLRQSLGATNTLQVPTAEARQGMLVDPEAPGGYRYVDVNPGSAVWLTAYPGVNSSRMFGPDIGEAIVPTTEPTRGDFFSIKMDYRFSGGDSLSFRYTMDDSSRQSPSATDISGLAIADIARNQYTTVEYAGAFNERVLNALRFGFSRNHDGSAWELDEIADEFSLIPGKPLGRVRVGGLSPLGVDTYRPNLWISNVYDVNDTVSWSLGEHTLKLGGQFKRTQVQTVADLRYSGEVAFSSLEKFLKGEPARFAGALPGSSSYRGFRRWYGALFIHDDWRVYRRLTLNLGLRWEVMPAVNEVNGRVARLENVTASQDFTVGNPWFVARNTLKGFAPRFGFAFDPTGSGRSVIRGGFGVFAEPIRENNFANARGTPPFVTDVVVNRPPWPYPLEGDVTIPPLSPTVMETNPKIPLTYQWNLAVQQRVFSGLVLTAGYLGSRSQNLGSVRCPNCAPGTVVGGRYYWEEGLSRPNPAFEYIRYLTMDASANYNAFQFRVDKRYSSGFAVQGSFTFSKAMDNGSGQSGSELGGVGNIYTRQNEQDLEAEWSLSSFDIRRNLSVNLSYELPFGPGKAVPVPPVGWMEKLAGGWKFNTILSLMDGSPATLNLDFNRSNNLHNRDIADRPDLKPGRSNNPVLGGPDMYYDPTAFVLQPEGFAGNLGRNTLILPGYAGLDASMSKRFALLRDSYLEFRGEIFNLLNHPNFAAPDLIPVLEDGSYNPTAGSIGSTRGPSRQMQFALRYVF